MAHVYHWNPMFCGHSPSCSLWFKSLELHQPWQTFSSSNMSFTLPQTLSPKFLACPSSFYPLILSYVQPPHRRIPRPLYVSMFVFISGRAETVIKLSLGLMVWGLVSTSPFWAYCFEPFHRMYHYIYHLSVVFLFSFFFGGGLANLCPTLLPFHGL